MKKETKIIAIDLGALGGKLFACTFKNDWYVAPGVLASVGVGRSESRYKRLSEIYKRSGLSLVDLVETFDSNGPDDFVFRGLLHHCCLSGNDN